MLFILQWQALLPQGVVFIQHIQIGPAIEQAVEHLDAVGFCLFQEHRQVVVLQGIGVQVQRAVGDAFLAQAIEHGVVRCQCRQADLAGQQFEYVGVLRHLQHITVVALLIEQPLRSGEDFLDPLADGLGAAVAEAAHP
ncbi:hypothetical protein D3C80_844450 [compost metagenome]